jgi:hypothetical protein
MSSDRESKTVAISLFEKADEQMIINADKGVKEAMVYSMQGDKQLTYIGLKHLTLLMSQKGNPLEVMDCEVKLDKIDPNNQATWIWYATYKVRNQKTQHESIGMSEASYFEAGKYDKFGRTKAMSKAERNAWRKQIPELEIRELIKVASADGSVKKFDGFQGDTSKKPEPKENTDGLCHCMDENTLPDYKTEKCGTCGFKMSEYKITRMKEADSKN